MSASVLRKNGVGSIVDLKVAAVTVDVSSSSDDQHLWESKFDWVKLDEQVSALGAQLVFGCESRDQLLAFADKVVDPLMPRSSARDSIGYAVGKGSQYEREWYKASRDSDILQGMSTISWESCKLTIAYEQAPKIPCKACIRSLCGNPLTGLRFNY